MVHLGTSWYLWFTSLVKTGFLAWIHARWFSRRMSEPSTVGQNLNSSGDSMTNSGRKTSSNRVSFWLVTFSKPLTTSGHVFTHNAYPKKLKIFFFAKNCQVPMIAIIGRFPAAEIGGIPQPPPISKKATNDIVNGCHISWHWSRISGFFLGVTWGVSSGRTDMTT